MDSGKAEGKDLANNCSSDFYKTNFSKNMGFADNIGLLGPEG